MNNQQHPITPPPELVQLWLNEVYAGNDPSEHLAARAAQWGADMELDACCEHVSAEGIEYARDLRAARRPKAPSLKEQALANLDRLIGDRDPLGVVAQAAIIRRALEQLDD